MKFNAVVLAGGRLGPYAQKGHVPFGGRPLMANAIAAVRELGPSRLIVAASPHPDITMKTHECYVPPSPKAGAWLSAHTALSQLSDSPDPVLLVTGDLPFVTGDHLIPFLEQGYHHPELLHYGLVPRDINESVYPYWPRSYLHLQEGDFLIAQAAFLPAHLLQQESLQMLEFYSRHYALTSIYILKLFWQIGVENIFKLRPDNLPLSRFFPKRERFAQHELEGLFKSMTRISVLGHIINHPQLTLDIDRPEQLQKLNELAGPHFNRRPNQPPIPLGN